MSPKLKPPPKISRLKEFYHYDLETGKFSHKIPTHLSKIGRIAGNDNGGGYTRIRLDGIWYLAHRLAWFYIYETWPEQIDHKNRVRSDNRIENLRPATGHQQQGNYIKTKKSGLPRGVYNHRGRYQVLIQRNGKQTNLGVFNSVEQANQAYQKAAKKYFGEYFYAGPYIKEDKK